MGGEQALERVGQGLGRADPAVGQLVEHFLGVAGPDVLLDEAAQARQFVLALEEQRGLFHVVAVVRGVDHSVARIVVQVGAGADGNACFVDRLVEALQQGSVGPGLVGGVDDLAQAIAQGGADDGVLAGGAGLAPLLQFDQHRVLGSRLVAPGEGDVDALGGLGDMQLDGQACVVGHFLVAQHLGHVAEGAFPRVDFRVADAFAGDRLEMLEDHLFDIVVVAVLQELLLGRFVNDHVDLP